MPDALSYDLHKLVARLDRTADGLLRSREQVTYSRFLALFAVHQGCRTQREVAAWLGQSEPSTSRMIGVLAGDGLLTVAKVPGAGNRRRLELTPHGAELVERCARLLEHEFEELVERSGVSFSRYQRDTRRLLAEIEAGASAGAGTR